MGISVMPGVQKQSIQRTVLLISLRLKYPQDFWDTLHQFLILLLSLKDSALLTAQTPKGCLNISLFLNYTRYLAFQVCQ